jgi:ACS family tartrate transporter-like MFS transporter
MINDPQIERAVRRAMFRKVVPILFGLYAFFSLDRGNVGLASLQMNGDLRISAAAYGLGAGLFTIAYLLFQVPATLFMKRLGAPRGFATIACAWGLVSMCTAFVWDANSFMVIRFLLGAAEAGFGAFVVYYVGSVFPRSMRGLVISSTLVAVPVTMMIASPISGVLLGWSHAGLRGWQWLFLIEGLPTIFFGLLALWLLPKTADDANFLDEAQRRWLVADIAQQDTDGSTKTLGSFWEAVQVPVVWVLGLTLFATVLGTNTLLFWMPQMIEQVSQASDAAVGWLNAVPWLAFAIGMLIMGRLSDRSRNKVQALSVAMIVSAAGFIVGGTATSLSVSFAGLLFGAFGVGASIALFWTVPLQMVRGSGLAGALAAVNLIGNSSGVFAHGIIGWLRDHTGGFGSTLIALGIVTIVATLGLNVFVRYLGADRKPESSIDRQPS